MPERRDVIVTNTTPLIALAVATGDLEILRHLYDRVVVPFEVEEELRAAGTDAPGVSAFDTATWLDRQLAPLTIATYLCNSLDRGKAAVIQTALTLGLPLVCIDEAVGRRVARLSGLTLTGTIGVLIKAKQGGYPIHIADALERLRTHGLWLRESVVRFALAQD